MTRYWIIFHANVALIDTVNWIKLVQSVAGTKWRTEHVETAHFYTNKEIDKLLSETEQTVTHELGNKFYELNSVG